MSCEKLIETYPAWMTCSLFEKHLRIYYKDFNLNVNAINVKCLSEYGGNATSLVYRVRMSLTNFHQIEKQVILKVPYDGPVSLLFKHVFVKETLFYNQIRPSIDNLLNKVHANKMFPDLIGICENKSIMLEDLTENGYIIPSDGIGFGLDDTRAILHKIAIFHGICAVLQEKTPDIFVGFSNGLVNRSYGEINVFLQTNCDAFCDLILSWPEYEYLKEKLHNFRSNLIEKCCQVYEPDAGHFNTLVHGDFWKNNMMFKYEQMNIISSIENIAFIDMQCTSWTSSTVDLYFITDYLEENIQFNNIETIIEYYHEKLVAVLKSLDYQKHIPTLEEFRQEYSAKSLVGFIASALICAYYLSGIPEIYDNEISYFFNQFTKEVKRKAYNTPVVAEFLRKRMPRFVSSGIFD